MLNELKNELNRTKTENGAKTLCSTLSDCLDEFATIGAQRDLTDAEIVERFSRAYAENAEYAMKILFFARDIRGGLGERKVFRTILKWLANTHPESVKKNIPLIAEYGRFDDLLSLLNTACEAEALCYLKELFEADVEKVTNEGTTVSLLGKWLPSVNASNKETVLMAKKIAKSFGLTDAQYRKALSKLRARIKIIENNLREKDYSFRYENVPSKALFKYREAFARNDTARYSAYLSEVAKGTKKMNTGTLVPSDIVSKIISHNGWCSYIEPSDYLSTEERESLNTTWNALPDYTTDEDSIVVVDGSGSMYGSGQPLPAAVALSLAIYFAEHNKGEYKNYFITFSEHPRLVEIKGKDIVDKVRYCERFNEVANTNIQAVFQLILSTAVKENLPAETMPKRIYIISDMEFDDCSEDADETNFEKAKRSFESAGYELPQIICWNVQSRHKQQPVRMDERGVALVSGHTPRLFQMMMSGEISPYAQMLEIIQSGRYELIHA